MLTQGIEIKHGSPQHGKIRDAIRERYNMSHRKMSLRHEEWENADKLFRAYVKETDEVKARQNKRDAGTAQYITLNIPYSYAILLTAHTYWTSVFLARSPVLQYSARHGEAQQQTQAVEALMDYQTQVGGLLVPLYMWLLDPGKYGFGVVGNYWTEEKQRITRIEEQPKTFMGMPVMDKTEKVRVTETIRGYAGNKLFNVRPYDFFPDPRVSLTNFQDGEFCGRLTQVGWNTIMEREADGFYFNVDHIRRLKSGSSIKRDRGMNEIELPDEAGDTELAKGVYGGQPAAELFEIVVELNPKEWKLHSSTRPEKWVFTLAGGEVVIGAQPLGADHNKFPFHLQTYEVDTYSHSVRGMMEILEPLNQTISWLVNSHFYNVRKALNDQLVVDPGRVVMKDLTDGGPGKLVRLKPGAYGTDVRTVVQQLPIMDITRSHLTDAEVVAELIQRIAGVTDNVMGMVNAGGRKTATEIRTSSSAAINRLKTHAEWNSALGMQPLAMMMLQNSQQHYTGEQKFRIAGDLIGQSDPFVDVTPESIAGFYDFVPVDGTLPVDRFAQANLWKELIMGLQNMPQIAMQYDMAGIFSWVAQLSGLKNISQFRVEVQPDQVMAAAAQAGNVVPMAGMGQGQGA